MLLGLKEYWPKKTEEEESMQASKQRSLETVGQILLFVCPSCELPGDGPKSSSIQTNKKKQLIILPNNLKNKKNERKKNLGISRKYLVTETLVPSHSGFLYP